MKLMIGAVSLSQEKYKALHEEAREFFDEIVLNPFGRQMSAEEVLENWQDADAILAGMEPYTRAMLEQAPKNLKVISRHGVGVDSIDLEACRGKGIAVCNTPGANAVAVAEAALGLMLSVLRRIPYSDRMIRSGNWKRPEGNLLKGALVGVLGMGNIGKNVILRAEAFGAEFMAFDPFFDRAFAEAHKVRQASRDEVLEQADIVTLHLPVTAETRGMICRETLRKMKPNAVLINTARGDLVSEADLAEALREGVIAGAGLDVFSKEPLRESPLFELDNVVLTPHMAGNTAQTTWEMGRFALRNAVRVIKNEEGASRIC